MTMYHYKYHGEMWTGIMRRNSWQEIQLGRRQRVWDTCSKYPELKIQEIDYTRYRYSPDFHLLFCGMGKVGSTTTMLSTFKQILEFEGEDLKGNYIYQGSDLKSYMFFLFIYLIQYKFLCQLQSQKGYASESRKREQPILKI